MEQAERLRVDGAGSTCIRLGNPYPRQDEVLRFAWADDVVRGVQPTCGRPGIDVLTPRWRFGTQNIGYALVTRQKHGQTVTWHTGATGGFASTLVLDRANDRAVVILANTTKAPAHDVGMMLIGERP